MSQNDPIDGMISDISIPSVEDVVDYRIYLAKPREEPFQYYKTRLEEIMAFVEKKIVKDYIWQDEPFSLTIVEGLESSSLEPALPAKSDSSIPLHCHFYGSTRFGDNIEDEWFIVSILQQLSLRFADLAISVVDNDGEFLLIEAAMFLPPWLKPETAIHRVWIHGGRFHIIPISSIPQLGLTHREAISRALEAITEGKDTVAPEKVALTIQKRVSNALNNAASNSTHWSACTLPVITAYVLKKKPEWISKVVTAFYHRDPANLRSASKFSRFGTGPKVNTMVRFTRTLYAQISSQHWTPPRIYGSSSSTQQPVSPLVQQVAFDIGAKLACGLEILYQQELDRANKYSATQALNTYPFNKDPLWKDYITKLVSIGYFRGLPETHIKYSELEKKAKQKFLTTHPEKAKSVLPMGLTSEIDAITGDSSFASLDDHQRAVMFPDTDLFASTPTNWMNVSPEEIDRILLERELEQHIFDEQRAGRDPSDPSSQGPKKSNDLFDTMAKDMERFLSLKSDVDGIDLDNAHPDGQPKSPHAPSSKTASSVSGSSGDGEVEDVDGDEDDDFYETDSDSEKLDLDDLDQDTEENSGEDILLDPNFDPSQLRSERTMMLEMMREMDAELLETELAKSFERGKRSSAVAEDDGDEEADLDVDTNLNLVKNFIESFAAQNGVAGPVSTLLGQLEDWKRMNAE